MKLFPVTVVFAHIEDIKTKGKLKILEKNNKKIENLDSTRWHKQYSQNRQSADETFQDLEQLNDRCMDKTESGFFVLYNAPPVKYKYENVSKNKLINVFNGSISSNYNNPASGEFFLIPLIEHICNQPKVSNSTVLYIQIYHDNVHLNYLESIPYLKKLFATTSEKK